MNHLMSDWFEAHAIFNGFMRVCTICGAIEISQNPCGVKE